MSETPPATAQGHRVAQPKGASSPLDRGETGAPEGAVTGQAGLPNGKNASKPAQTDMPIGQSESSRKAYAFILGLAIFLVLCATVSLMLGRYPISPSEAMTMLASKIVALEQTWTDQQYAMFFNVRLPRIVLAILVGCCLATAGAAFQGTFQNPLVSPDILGASQGAAFGAALAILAGCGASMVSLSAFIFAIVAVGLVLVVSARARGNRILITVLAGTMISSLFSAGVSYAKLAADPQDDLPAITYWLMGSLTGAKFDMTFALALIPMAIGIIILFALRWKINILTMGDDEASTMGIDARKIRIVVIFAATLVTAASVAVSGMIGWVGLVVPHLCRMIVGADYRKLIPCSMLLGASFLLLVDNIARLVSTAEIPIGILTAFVGAPFFLYLITRRKQQL